MPCLLQLIETNEYQKLHCYLESIILFLWIILYLQDKCPPLVLKTTEKIYTVLLAKDINKKEHFIYVQTEPQPLSILFKDLPEWFLYDIVPGLVCP